MPFSFLYPWLWLGALAVGIPIWLHLRRRQQTNLLRFSAVQFLRDQPEPRRSPLRPRDLLLLALRVLAVLLLTGAFAWPFVRTLNTVPIEESRVYILDNTLSRQAEDGFSRDRERLASDLSRLGSDRQVAIVELRSAPRAIAAFGDSRETLLESVRSLRPSFERGSYLAAFRQANALLANSLGRKKRIVLLGDNQENQWAESLNSPAFLRDVELDLPAVQEQQLPNVSVCDARVQRIFLGDRSLVNFTVKLSHTGPAKTANLTLRANGQLIANREVPLEGQPETTLLQAQWESDPASAVRGEVSVAASPDALAADNRVFFSLAPVAEGKVALLAQSPYLRVALSPEIMRGEWALRIIEPASLGRELMAAEDADVLCLESTYLQSGDARKLVQRYLSNGRGVFLLVNRPSPVVDGCLRELGFTCEGTARPEQPETFQFIYSNHPIFHPFLSPDYGNLMEIRISEYARLKPLDATPLVFSESGAGLFFQGTRAQGKLFVCAFGLDRDHTSWPIHQSFIPFLDLVLQAARAQDPIPASFDPGDVANVQLPGSISAQEAVVKKDGVELTRATVEQGRVRLHVPDEPGIYDLAFDNAQAPAEMLCVNAPAKESQLRYSDPASVVQGWRIDTSREKTPGEAPPRQVQVRLAGVLQQHFWWWMVLAAVLALLVETAWAATRTQKT